MKTSITERRSCLVFLAFQQYSSVRPISEEYNWQSFFKKNEMNFEEMLITFNLCSRRFTMTAVICWSIKIKITARNDGPIATIDVHHGLLSNGCINQPRFYKVITIIDKKSFTSFLIIWIIPLSIFWLKFDQFWLSYPLHKWVSIRIGQKERSGSQCYPKIISFKHLFLQNRNTEAIFTRCTHILTIIRIQVVSVDY